MKDLNCNECQEFLGADPDCTVPEVVNHLSGCDTCRQFQMECQRLDSLLMQALKVDAPSASELMDIDYSDTVVKFPGSDRQPTSNRFIPFAMAASVLLVLAASFLSWQGANEESWAKDIIAHVEHEPGAFAFTAAVPKTKVIQVAQRTGVRVQGDLGEVTYIKACPFRGRMVTHLITQTEKGPVTVLLLPGETVEKPEHIDEEGYVGTVLPFNGGSIVVVGGDAESAQEVQKRMSSSVVWDI
ncbi:MAG: DUF3379 family protein [Pseudomonadota bacterium]